MQIYTDDTGAFDYDEFFEWSDAPTQAGLGQYQGVGGGATSPGSSLGDFKYPQSDYYGTERPQTWDQWTATQGSGLQGYSPAQLNALEGAFGRGGAVGAGEMFQHLYKLSPDLTSGTVEATLGAVGNYVGPNDVYGWEDGVRAGTVDRLDNGGSWVYRDGMGNILGEVNKSATAADRMATAGVTDLMQGTMGGSTDTTGIIDGTDNVIVNDAPVPVLQDADTALQYQPPDTPGLANLPEQRQTLWDILTGETVSPFLTKILAGDYIRQEQERDDLAASLAMRGIRNSTPGWVDYTNLSTQQLAANARTGLEALGVVGPQMQAAINAVYEQDMGVDERAYQQWSDTTRLQSDLDWRQDQTRNQSLDLLLRALAPGAVGAGGAGGYNVPGAEPGMFSNLLEAYMNAQDPADWQWWPGGD